MSDLNDKMKERWNQRRKKSYNWVKLLIMVCVLVAILWLMGEMERSRERIRMDSTPETVDSVHVGTNEDIMPEQDQ